MRLQMKTMILNYVIKWFYKFTMQQHIFLYQGVKNTYFNFRVVSTSDILRFVIFLNNLPQVLLILMWLKSQKQKEHNFFSSLGL
jgi:hypothetical protein